VAGLRWLPRWNIFLQLPAFLVYLIAAIAENNRPPFDLTEAETELVAGYQTEYSGMRFAFFYLAEYMHLVTLSAVATTLFLGGWRGPIWSFLPWLWPLLWFLLKLIAMLYAYIWIRATLPRFRYDRLMSFGWKVLIPSGLVWVLATGAVVVVPEVYSRHTLIVWVGVVAGVLLLWSLVWPLFAPKAPAPAASEAR